jgi:hypothetical protein
LSARQPLVDHRADDARHNEVKSRDDQQQEQSHQYLPKIWLEKDSYLQQVFHIGIARIPQAKRSGGQKLIKKYLIAK